MFFKSICFILFLIFIELLVEIKGNGAKEDESIQLKTKAQASYREACERTIKETLDDLKYVQLHWEELLLVEQEEVTRLYSHLDHVVKRTNPSKKVELLSADILINNEDIVLPALKVLIDCLKFVKLKIQGLGTEESFFMKKVMLNREIALLATAVTKVDMKMSNVLMHCNKLPPLVVQSINQHKDELDHVIKIADRLPQNVFPTREDLIAKRYAIMPLITKFNNLLINLEATYLKGQSTTGQQKVQEKLNGQVGQTCQVIQTVQQVGPGSSKGQVVQPLPGTSPLGSKGQVKQGAQKPQG